VFCDRRTGVSHKLGTPYFAASLTTFKTFVAKFKLWWFFAPHLEKYTIEKFITWDIDNNWHINKITWNSPIQLLSHRIMDPVLLFLSHPIQEHHESVRPLHVVKRWGDMRWEVIIGNVAKESLKNMKWELKLQSSKTYQFLLSTLTVNKRIQAYSKYKRGSYFGTGT
jgi:hypothetical protein